MEKWDDQAVFNQIAGKGGVWIDDKTEWGVRAGRRDVGSLGAADQLKEARLRSRFHSHERDMF
jgi:hypothetical protein